MAYVRRRSSAFSRGKSRFRGVSGHAGRWEARIGAFAGRKNVSLLFCSFLALTQEASRGVTLYRLTNSNQQLQNMDVHVLYQL